MRWEDPETGVVSQLDASIEIHPGADFEGNVPLRFAALVANAAELLRANAVVVGRGVIDSLASMLPVTAARAVVVTQAGIPSPSARTVRLAAEP